jgi:hypothetical protein
MTRMSVNTSASVGGPLVFTRVFGVTAITLARQRSGDTP